jgi:3-oxoacyl-[acyl-carrier protein] reductase
MANAATTMRNVPVTEMSDDAWDRTILVNLTGAFYLVRAAGRTMTEQQSGSLLSARLPAPGAAYSAAQDLVAGVGTCQPDPAQRYPVAVAAMNQEWLAGIRPLKRTGRPEDVAQPALFLACDRSAFVTGDTINVDGGIHFNWGDLAA